MDGKLWFSRKGTVVTLGITNAGLEEIGDIESIELPDDGGDFDKGEVIVTIEGTNDTLEVITPAAGLVHEVNTKLMEAPETLAEDPLEEGWLVKIEIQDPSDLAQFVENSDADEE